MFSCDFCKISSNIFFYRTTPDSCFWNIIFCSWNSAISPWIFVRTQNRVVATPLLIEFNLLYLVFNLCKSLACLFKWVFNMSRLKSSLSLLIIKSKFQNGCFKKTKHVKFSEKRTFLTVCVSGGKKWSFLETPVLRFVFLYYYWRIVPLFWNAVLSHNVETFFISKNWWMHNGRSTNMVKLENGIEIFGHIKSKKIYAWYSCQTNGQLIS